MGRVINPNGVGKQRKQLLRGVVLALRELAAQSEPSEQTRDLVAFIILSLQAISETIEQSVGAWEKRGYWLKADRFRLEWAWAETYSAQMQSALLEDDWQLVATTAVKIAGTGKVQNVKLPQRHRLGTPWVGAWDHLQTMGSPRARR